jgi:predicted RNase H-like nuclease (RuvC/YqgF family)
MPTKKSTSSKSKSITAKPEAAKVVDHSEDIATMKDQLKKAEAMISKLSEEISNLKKEFLSHDHTHEHNDKPSSAKDMELRAALLKWSPKLARHIK